MTRCLVILLVFLVTWVTGGAWAQTRPNDRPPYAPVQLQTACGPSTAPQCAKVLPVLAAPAARAGLNLKPAASRGVPDTVAAVCEGPVAAGIVPHDAAGPEQPAGCEGRYDIVGRPLYPVYAFLLVKADAPFRHLDDFRGEGANEQPRVIVTLGGATITLEAVRRTNPAWQRIVVQTNLDLDVALQRLTAGTVDGVFAMEPLDNELIDRVRLRTDERGRPIYKFIDAFPPKDFFRMGDGQGRCLYRPVALDFGGPLPVTTFSVDAVFILGRGFRDARAKGGPPAFEGLASAIDKARDTILTATKSPRDWRPIATSCQ